MGRRTKGHRPTKGGNVTGDMFVVLIRHRPRSPWEGTKTRSMGVEGREKESPEVPERALETFTCTGEDGY